MGEPIPEPTVLDWLRSVLRGKPLPLGGEAPPGWLSLTPEPSASTAARPSVIRVSAAHLRLPVAVMLALIAQVGLEKRSEGLGLFVLLYIAAAGLAGWAVWSGDFGVEVPLAASGSLARIRFRPALVLGLVLSILTFLTSNGNQFRSSTLIFWASSCVVLLYAFWEGDLRPRTLFDKAKARIEGFRGGVRIRTWTLVLLLALGLSAYFRFVDLGQVPPEMVSDHAEKILDVVDIQNGNYAIYFPRNTGREALQFYLAVATDWLLGTGASFLTLKIGTALLGLLTLPYLYLFAKEIGGRWVGLAALCLAGVAYWPNVISRIGLRFPLYPFFVAPALYYLARGIRLHRRNDLLLCGFFVGLGLHGYTPARMIPVAVAAGLGLYLLHREARGQRRVLIGWLVAAGLVALFVFVPLLRVALDLPELFLFRALSRLGTVERELPGPALPIFLSNLWNALRMFAWDNGDIWVDSIPHRPALDAVTGALFHLGAAILAVRYLRRRNWLDLYVLLSIPILMLPSILSLAFPGENPTLNRAGGAIVPVFSVAAVALAAIPDWARSVWSNRRGFGLGLTAALGLFGLAAAMNYRLVFRVYADLYRSSSWNTSEAGRILRGFADSIGTSDTAHVMGFPHWMDTRLVGIAAGEPTRDYATWPEQLESLLGEPRPQLFLINPLDTVAVERLRELFPHGHLQPWSSSQVGHDFLLYWVSPSGSAVGPGPAP